VNSSTLADLHARIEVIERGYEFMLAYAAQGFEANQQSGQVQEIRTHLTGMDEALQDLGKLVGSVAKSADGDLAAGYASFIAAVSADAEKAQGALRVVLARPGISSQLVDNLNASIHLRALLTDLFLIDEAFKG
jgi:hypothetical protein